MNDVGRVYPENRYKIKKDDMVLEAINIVISDFLIAKERGRAPVSKLVILGRLEDMVSDLSDPRTVIVKNNEENNYSAVEEYTDDLISRGAYLNQQIEEFYDYLSS